MRTVVRELVSLALLSTPLAASAAAAKVDICHNTGTGTAVKVSVPPVALAAHFAKHGDYYPATWYTDADGDGYGADGTATLACAAVAGGVEIGGDADDGDASVYPGAPDTCDGVDNDTDGSTDEDALDGAQLLARYLSTLYTYDTTDGTPTTIAELQSSEVDVTGINSLTSDLVTGDTYGVERVSDQLVSVDVCSGEVSVVGPLGYTNTCGIALGPDGDLYGIDSGVDALLKIDPVTGAATTVGTFTFDLKNCGMAYDCATDTLYGLHIDTKGEDFIFTIDATTGATDPVVTLDPSVEWSQAGLEVDVAGGVYYVSMLTGVYAVDALTGDATQLSEDGPIDNLTWWSGVCE